jgi:hypothetical protein
MLPKSNSGESALTPSRLVRYLSHRIASYSRSLELIIENTVMYVSLVYLIIFYYVVLTTSRANITTTELLFRQSSCAGMLTPLRPNLDGQ